MDKIYFGHPICFYNTAIEAYLLERIGHRFNRRYEIENPGTEKHQKKCEEYKAAGRNAMEYFVNEVLPGMSAGVFMPFPEEKGVVEKFGAGVYLEAQVIRDAGKPIYEVRLNGSIDELVLDEARKLNVDDTRAKLKEFFKRARR